MKQERTPSKLNKATRALLGMGDIKEDWQSFCVTSFSTSNLPFMLLQICSSPVSNFVAACPVRECFFNG